MQIILAAYAFSKRFTVEVNAVSEKPKRDEVEKAVAADSPRTDPVKISTGFSRTP